MRLRSLSTRAGLIAGIAALALAVASSSGAAADKGDDVLKIGWGQDPQTLNVFVGLDEEEYEVWALNYDLLVNFNPKDLTPTPGIAESWDVSEDKKTVTFHLVPDAKWSDGKPITSADVKYSLETLGSHGALFTSYTDNVSSIETPDAHTVVIHTKVPDARIVGGLFIYIIPEHVWGKQSVDTLTGSYQPDLPLVGSGPYVVTEFEPGRIVRMERNPYFSGPKPAFDQIQFIKYGSQDAAERALQLGEVDLDPEIQAATFERLGTEANVATVKAPSPAFTEMAFNLCSEKDCPDANFNPAIQDRAVRQAVAYSIDRNRINEIAARGTSFVGHGLLPEFYKSFYEQPADDYPYDPEKAKEILDKAGWQENGDGPRTKGDEELSFNLYARSESPYTIQAAKLVAEQAADVGIDFHVQVVSTDKLTELTVQEVDGKPAPDFDTFIWGWGGDPYDPSFLLGLLTSGEIGNSSDSFYSNPEYDRLFEKQSTVFDTAERKQIIQRMIAISQRDVPYIVLTQDPNLQAYRTDRIADVVRSCPESTGDVFCEQISYEPVLSLTPGSESSDSGGGGSTVAIIIVAAAVVAVGGFFVIRSRRRRKGEPLEVEE
jgi:peptide/nickel transport system substrate-binding protein